MNEISKLFNYNLTLLGVIAATWAKTSSGWNTSINLKGTSKVVASTWIDYDWNSLDTDTEKWMIYTIPNPFFAALGKDNLWDILEMGGGVFLAYGMNHGSGAIILFNYENNSCSYKANPDPIDDEIFIRLTKISGPALHPWEYDPAHGNQFRFVLISPDFLLSGNSATTRSASDIDWSKLSYEEVVELLQLDN